MDALLGPAVPAVPQEARLWPQREGLGVYAEEEEEERWDSLDEEEAREEEEKIEEVRALYLLYLLYLLYSYVKIEETLRLLALVKKKKC